MTDSATEVRGEEAQSGESEAPIHFHFTAETVNPQGGVEDSIQYTLLQRNLIERFCSFYLDWVAILFKGTKKDYVGLDYPHQATVNETWGEDEVASGDVVYEQRLDLGLGFYEQVTVTACDGEMVSGKEKLAFILKQLTGQDVEVEEITHPETGERGYAVAMDSEEAMALLAAGIGKDILTEDSSQSIFSPGFSQSTDETIH